MYRKLFGIIPKVNRGAGRMVPIFYLEDMTKKDLKRVITYVIESCEEFELTDGKREIIIYAQEYYGDTCVFVVEDGDYSLFTHIDGKSGKVTTPKELAETIFNLFDFQNVWV